MPQRSWRGISVPRNTRPPAARRPLMKSGQSMAAKQYTPAITLKQSILNHLKPTSMLYQIMDIMDLQDVETFLEQIAHEIDNFHPMVDFNSYVYPDSYMRRYNEEEAEIRNKLLDRCFDICATSTPDFHTYLLQLHKLVCAEMHREAKRSIIRAAANGNNSYVTQLQLILPHQF